MHRFTKLTNAFSKKCDDHKAAVALYFIHYNSARLHKMLRVMLAIEAGLSDHVLVAGRNRAARRLRKDRLMETIRLKEFRIPDDPAVIEFEYRPRMARKPSRFNLGASEARVLAYSLLAAAERADRAKSN